MTYTIEITDTYRAQRLWFVAIEEDAEFDDLIEFRWSEGTMSCDCSRGRLMALVLGHLDPHLPCVGQRYTVRVVAADGRVLLDEGEDQ